MKTGCNFAGRQLLGSRKVQEDSYAFSIISETEEGEVDKLLVIIADGMGGHSYGQRASQIAVEGFIEEFFQHESTLDSDDSFALHESLMFANECLSKSIDAECELSGMGTTLLAATISRTRLQWISVGDSPLFLFRDNVLQRLNEDHSMRPLIAREIEMGILEADAINKHPQRNVIRSALLGEEIPLIDAPSKPFEMQPDDILLFASDGLQVLEDSEIAELLIKNPVETAPQVIRSLFAAIEERNIPRQDNVTIAAVLVE